MSKSSAPDADTEDSSGGDEDNPGIPNAEDAPEITDHEGPWDEVVNRAILLAPWLAAAVLLGWLIATGSLSMNVRIEGTVSAAPLVGGAAILIGATYLLAVMKFYGARPVVWVANTAANYNPDQEGQ